MQRLSIIICTRDNAEYLRGTLESVEKCHHPQDCLVELLVIDNGSTDHTREVVANAKAQRLTIRYVFESKLGKGHAYNAALAHAQGNILLFTDDDVRVPEDWIVRMTAIMDAEGLDAVAGGVVLAKFLERPWLNSRLRGALASTENLDPKEPYMMIGANMGFRRRVLDQVPAFDPELGPGALGFYEESLFTWQLKRAGYKIGSAFSAAVEHHCDTSRLHRQAFLRTSEKYGRSEAYVYHHYYHGKKRFVAMRLVVAYLWLSIQRMLHPSNWWRREGASNWELDAAYHIGFFSQYLIERQRLPNYEPFGLRKLLRT